MKLKLLLMLILSLMTVASAMPAAASDYLPPGPMPSPPPPGTGIIQLISPHNLTLEPGETLETRVTIRNVGSLPVYDLFSTPAASAFAPFTVEFVGNSNRVFMLGVNGQRHINMRIIVNENAEAGEHSIEISHFFNDERGIMSAAADSISVLIEDDEEDEDDGEANVRLGGFQASHTAPLAPEQTFSVTANIQNVGDALARDVRVSLPENMRADDSVFIVSDLNDALISSMEEGYSRQLSFQFRTSDDIATGAHTILFEVSFRDENADERISDVFPFIVNAYNPEEDETAPMLQIRDVATPPGNVLVDQNGVISFTVFNAGAVEARNVRIEASVPGFETAVVPMTANIQSLGVLAPGESRAISFTFSPRAAATTRSYAVLLRTSFEYGRDGEDSFEQFASFNVYNPEEEEDEDETDDDRAQIPRVIVSAHTVTPSVPRAGTEFELQLTFRNTNANLSVNNIRVRLEEVTGAATFQGQQVPFAGFVPVDGSDTLFVDALPPLGETSMTLRYVTSVDATAGTHNLRVHFDYQDQNFRTHEANQQISITIAQVARLEIINVNVPETAMVGSSVWFSYTIANSGRVNLINARIDTEGEFDVTDAQDFRGNVNAQRVIDATGFFVPLEPGRQEGRFIVRAEDNVGAIVEGYHDFVIMVEGGDDFGFDFEGGDWDGAWGDDMGRPIPPGRVPDGGMVFPGDVFVMPEAPQPGLFARIFTRAVPPAHWEEEFFGPFTPENAAMMGFPTERGIRWSAIIAVAAIALAAIAAPVAIVVVKRRNKLDFDDED